MRREEQEAGKIKIKFRIHTLAVDLLLLLINLRSRGDAQVNVVGRACCNATSFAATLWVGRILPNHKLFDQMHTHRGTSGPAPTGTTAPARCIF